MIVNAYQNGPRNNDFVSAKPANQTKNSAGETLGGWFARYASLLSNIWGKDTPPLV